MPLIHRNIEILRDKLAKSDLQCVNKRIGINRTLMFAIGPLKYDPDISILGRLQLADWLACRESPNPQADVSLDSRNGMSLITRKDALQPSKPKKDVPQHPKPKQDVPQPSKPKHVSTKSSKDSTDALRQQSEVLSNNSSRDSTDVPQPTKPKHVSSKSSNNSTYPPHQQSEVLPNNSSRHSTNVPEPPKPKHVSSKSSNNSTYPPHQQSEVLPNNSSRHSTNVPEPPKPKHVSTKSSKDSTNVLHQQSEVLSNNSSRDSTSVLEPTKPKQVSTKSSKDSTDVLHQQSEVLSNNSSQDSTSAIWECEVDALIINEKIDDEFANLSDEEDETEIAKNRKKIRVEVPPKSNPVLQSKQPSNVSTKTNNTPTESTKPQAKSNSVSNGIDELETELLAPPTVQPQPVLEPNWPETAKQLLNNQFNLVFKDLFHFKDKVKRDNTARQLLKDTVIKCIQEDETSQLIEFLALVYEVQITDDSEFWSELVLRLKRKLNSHSTLKCFKSKANPEWIFNNYKNAIASIGRHAREIDLTMKLPFNTMIWLIDLSKPPQPTPVAPNPELVIKQEGSLMADTKFNVKFIKLKTEIKDEPETHEQQTPVVNGTSVNTIPIINPTVNNNNINSEIPPQRRDEKSVETIPVTSNGNLTSSSSNVDIPITTTSSKMPVQEGSRKVVAETNDRGRMSFKITKKRRTNRTKQ